MNVHSPLQRFESQLAPSCTELFSAYGISLKRPQALAKAKVDPPDVLSGGVVRFSGASMSGSLLLVAPFPFLASCRPLEIRSKQLLMSSSADWILVRDWTMELANQLLGRIRNRLYSYGITLDSKSPTALSGHALVVALQSRSMRSYAFLTPDGQTLRVSLEAKINPAFESIAPANAETPVPEEGDVILF